MKRSQKCEVVVRLSSLGRRAARRARWHRQVPLPARRLSATARHLLDALGKLLPPPLGRTFAREWRFAALDDLATYPGVWITAPPGAGKTTLVAT